MNRVYVAAWMLVLMLKTGCPALGEAGVFHQAMLKDEIKRLANDSCDPGDVWDECGPDEEQYARCMKSCEEEMKKRKARK